MNLRQLSYFVSIARLGSFTRAAEQLRIAQPALSRHMRLLEAEFGMPLLSRNGRGALPTLAGKALLKHAVQILAACDAAKLELATLANRPTGIVRLGVPPAVSECLTAEFLEVLNKRYPQVSLQITERWTGYLRELVLEKKLDFAVLSITQLTRKFHHVALVEEPVYLITAPRHAPGPPVKIRELANIPLVLAPHPHGSRLVVEQTLKKFSIKPNIVLESDIWSVIKDAVQKDVAATLVPRRDVIEELRRGVLQATPLQKPGIRHTIALARLTGGRRASFEDELFGFLASRLQQALAIRENHAGAAPT